MDEFRYDGKNKTSHGVFVDEYALVVRQSRLSHEIESQIAEQSIKANQCILRIKCQVFPGNDMDSFSSRKPYYFSDHEML